MSNEEDKETLLTNEETLTSDADENRGDSNNNGDNNNNSKDAEKENVDQKLYENMSTKEAYFLSLNQWVTQANIAQNAMALFPWYLMTTYPEIFQQPQQEGQANAFATLTAALWGSVPPPQQPQSAQSPQSEQPSQERTDTANIQHTSSNNNDNGGEGVVMSGSTNNMSNNDIQNVGTAATVEVTSVLNRPNDDTISGGPFRILSEQSQTELINITGGYEYVIAPFWKRIAAEMIDALILLSIKMLLMLFTIMIFDFEFGFTFDMDKEMLGRMLQRDEYYGLISIVDILSFSSNLLFVEVIVKVLGCFYEAACTAWFNGATPGKALVGLSIKYVEAIHMLQPPPQPPFPQHPIQLGLQQARVELRAILYPAETPTFLRALLRALAKTMIISMLFPMCFVVFVFKNNRLAYDFITKTIVVIQPKQRPPFRRDIR